jgi:hypothetical protein
MGTRELWHRKLREGAEVSAVLRYSGGVGATVELIVQSAHAEDVTATALADALRELLHQGGAKGD